MREDKLKLNFMLKMQIKIKELEQVKSHISQLEIAVFRINNVD